MRTQITIQLLASVVIFSDCNSAVESDLVQDGEIPYWTDLELTAGSKVIRPELKMFQNNSKTENQIKDV